MSSAVLHEAPARARATVAPLARPVAPATDSASVAVRHGYLVAAAVLAPLCVPAGPGQTAALDFVNVLVLMGAVFALLVPGVRVRLPMLAPAVLILFGSLLALLQAPSLKLAALALAQDFYLFAWFALMVNLVRTRTDLRVLTTAWTATAVAVSVVALVQIVLHDGTLAGFLGSRGFRPSGTLYNPNMLADYLVTSLFVAGVALHRRALVLRLAVTGVLLAGLLATKSNGGMVALAAGLMVWLLVRALTRRVPLAAMLATVSLVLAAGGFGLWLNSEWGVGDSALASFRQHTFAGRLEHSSESRLKIWDQLQRTYARSPLGIGPGNSGAITLGIAERERPDSWLSKEAHSDYLAYAIERGPLGVIGLLWWTCAGFAAVVAWAGAAHATRPGGAARNASRGAGPAPRYVERPGAAEARAREEGRDHAFTAAMAAVLAASAMHSTVIEKLHFRHFWLVLALLCGAAAMAREAAAAAEDEAPLPVPQTPAPAPALRALPAHRTGTAVASRGALSVEVLS